MINLAQTNTRIEEKLSDPLLVAYVRAVLSGDAKEARRLARLVKKEGTMNL